MSVTRVNARPEAGFNYPYLLSVPDEVEELRPILVEPTNTGDASDEFDRHLAAAERRARRGFGRAVAEELAAPFLHPVFPRPVSVPVDWTHTIHQLDTRTMAITDGPLARVDRQLLAMVADARKRLAERGIRVPSKFMLNGFSSAGAFVNCFAALHPEHVLSVSAGGFNGMAILPLEESDGHTLSYPVGVADVEALTGDPFDLAAFRDVHQFLYVGGDDDRDTIPYPDIWTDGSLVMTALRVYGTDIHRERFPTCRCIYEAAGVPAVFRQYEGIEHVPAPIEDVVAFHERSLAGDDVRDIRADLGGGVPAPQRRSAGNSLARSRLLMKRSVFSALTRTYFTLRAIS